MHGNGPRSYGRPPTAACRTLTCASSPHAKVEPRMGLVRPSLGENGPTECGESLVSGRAGAAGA